MEKKHVRKHILQINEINGTTTPYVYVHAQVGVTFKQLL